ncbi:MAG: glycosyltransferase family 4 protein [Lentimicrobiaceae bacterium]|nr:glycosyltransferase family 4 protein [Lentimicrobiaceae bacterium]
MKVYHISTVHPRYDGRIKKECVSLLKAGFNVSFVVADGKRDEWYAGVKIIDAGFPGKGRRKRFLKGTKLVRKVIERDKPDVLHFHDPELLFLARRMAKKYTVIYDAHEDLPKQIMSKPYIRPVFRKIIAFMAGWVEKRTAKKIYGAISVVDEIVERYQKQQPNTILLANYPAINLEEKISFELKTGAIVYAGSVAKIRGAAEMVTAAQQIQIPIHIYGKVEKECELLSNTFAKFYGQIMQEELFNILKNASIGLIILHPVPNYINSSPNKLFEYMAYGMAVIASDFPVWQNIIDTYKCGICVNPLDINEIANAILYLKNNPETAIEMGKNGRKAVIEHFNWEIESRKLVAFYRGGE